MSAWTSAATSALIREAIAMPSRIRGVVVIFFMVSRLGRPSEVVVDFARADFAKADFAKADFAKIDA